MLLIDRAGMDARRAVASGPLSPLANSLAADLAVVQRHDLYFPAEKALLSREGGRCTRDGTLLEFDPFNRHEHRCPSCGTVHRGELHDRFWIYWYQLWLAERAVHAAVLSRLGVGEGFAAVAASILDGYADRYLSYSNVDNVLGPTRLFFSTYLESIWLLQICIAADLIEEENPALAARVVERIVEPSREIIAEYDEGASNRQVWNDAALLAAARLLDDDRAAEDAVFGASGVATHLSDGLLADGTWYEGENYHLFAHRGLWYGVQMAERAGLELPRMLVDRLQLGFAAPFASALPDFTLPSRRDSQYAISLRQWRIAEHTELGVARRQDEDLLAALREMYQPDLESRLPRADTRWSSSADVERNGPPSALARSDLSWRALLFALPALPALGSATPRSALLESQGLAVFRRENARIYAALDYGHSGGGHGHPDRLNLLLATRLTRWLDDFGTGSYVDPSLHWYRSTLAHNAPLVDGHSQSPVHGELLAYDERDGAGWIAAAAEEIAPGVSASRTLVVMPDYCVDVVRWDAERDVVVDLPLHADLELVDANAPLEPRALTGGHRTEDGFDFVRDCSVQDVPANAPVVAGARSSDESLRMFASSDRDVEWWRATAPGAPGRGDHVFRILRARGRSGEHRLVWCWGAAVRAVDFKGGIRLTLADGATHRHEASDTGWRVAVVDGATTTVAELAGVVAREPDMPVEPRRERRATAVAVSRTGKPTVVRLGEPHYRRSEESWAAAGEPRATVTFTWQLDGLHITVDVPRSDLTFVAPATVNPYDNEPAGINGDGVQLYVRDSAERQRAWLLVPIAGGDDVAQRAIDGWESEPAPRTHWTRRGLGYSLDITLPGDAPLEIDLAVNEMPRGRVRRRGQLVLGGAEGQFVYLRGDRQDPSRLVRLTLTDA